MKRLIGRLLGRRIDREIARELDVHVAERTDDLVEEGMDPAEARRQALREIGNRTAIRETIYEGQGWPLLDGLATDLGLGIRNILRRPAFSTGTALTLAIGIAATTTVFAVVDGVMLRDLPYEEPSRLVTIGAIAPGGGQVAPGVLDLGPISIFHYQQGVVAHVVVRGLELAAIGLGVGLVLTVVSTRLLAGLLFGIEPLDPATLVLATTALVVTSAIACLGPALRAATVDPLKVLRED